jgi:uncharacterized membrane protein YeaQ/YmgE (transglycosylase-associated protein family)
MPYSTDGPSSSTQLEDFMIGAIILGLLAGLIARAIVPGDVFERMGGPVSWLLSIIVGLVGAWVGWWVFTGLLGIGDDDMFDLGGIIGAIVGAVLLLVILTWIARSMRGTRA